MDKVQKRQKIVGLARRYYDGDHPVVMTSRQKAYLAQHGDSSAFCINFCQTVIDAVVERLLVTGFTSHEGDDSDQVIGDFVGSSGFNILQNRVHTNCGVDGEAFVSVFYDNALGLQALVYPAFVPQNMGGTGVGCVAEYEEDDSYGRLMCVKRRFYDRDKEGNQRQRLTVYYDDRVEKYYVDSKGEYIRLSDPGDKNWPVSWTDSDGTPLGCAIVHFKNPNITSDLKEAIPVQDAYNKNWIDILATADQTAFRMLMIIGAIPTTDGKKPNPDLSNLLTILPGQMWATEKKPNEVSVESIEPGSITAILELEHRIVVRLSGVTDIPVSRFVVDKAFTSGESQNQGNDALFSKCTLRQSHYTDGWTRVTILGLKLARIFGGKNIAKNIKATPVWKELDTRAEERLVKISLDKLKLSVPLVQLLAEMGYTEDQIAEFQKSDEYAAYASKLKLAIIASEGVTTGG